MVAVAASAVASHVDWIAHDLLGRFLILKKALIFFKFFNFFIDSPLFFLLILLLKINLSSRFSVRSLTAYCQFLVEYVISIARRPSSSITMLQFIFPRMTLSKRKALIFKSVMFATSVALSTFRMVSVPIQDAFTFFHVIMILSTFNTMVHLGVIGIQKIALIYIFFDNSMSSLPTGLCFLLIISICSVQALKRREWRL